jgi:hypothetical protein
MEYPFQGQLETVQECASPLFALTKSFEKWGRNASL